jgi:sodium/potassium-transporting ATPase subunit alpha
VFSATDANFPMEGFTFAGLVSMMDPPRSGVAEAVAECKSAGVKVVMITGDHAFTAEAIARKVGIIGDFRTADDVAQETGAAVESVDQDAVGAIVVPGSELLNFSDADWNRVLDKKEIVFARTTPQQKLEIVTHLQGLGHVVAVTGDGVNDAPALKKADIGIAMGITGSELAKESADAILMDDNFASIVEGIRLGRLLYDNLKKTVAYTLTHLWPEVVPTLCSLAFGIPLALTSLLILAIDLGTELAPAISLAFEKAENDIMRRPPRPSNERLVTWQIFTYSYVGVGSLQTLVCFLAFFLVLASYGVPASSTPFTSATYWTATSPQFNATISGVPLQAQEQVSIITVGVSAYFVTLVMQQVRATFYSHFLLLD